MPANSSEAAHLASFSEANVRDLGFRTYGRL
jgi:hypothetical protein